MRNLDLSEQEGVHLTPWLAPISRRGQFQLGHSGLTHVPTTAQKIWSLYLPMNWL